MCFHVASSGLMGFELVGRLPRGLGTAHGPPPSLPLLPAGPLARPPRNTEGVVLMVPVDDVVCAVDRRPDAQGAVDRLHSRFSLGAWQSVPDAPKEMNQGSVRGRGHVR